MILISAAHSIGGNSCEGFRPVGHRAPAISTLLFAAYLGIVVQFSNWKIQHKYNATVLTNIAALLPKKYITNMMGKANTAME